MIGMTDFEQRLTKAIERGQRSRNQRLRDEAEKQLNEEEFKRLHSDMRLELSEHIEACLENLPDHFPGFKYETVVGDRGWGAACSRDDIGAGSDGKRRNFYSRIEMTVRPFAAYHVFELNAKGTIRNKEIFSRKHFQKLVEADLESFKEIVDLWVLEYAELYAAK